jgi:hypothetical protein
MTLSLALILPQNVPEIKNGRGAVINAYRILVGRPRHMRKIILKWALKQDVDLIHLALNRHQQRTLVNTIVNIRVP